MDRNDPMLLLPQLFKPTDMYEGAVLRFHHCPDQKFEVLKVDNSGSGLSDEMVDETPTVTELDMLLARIAWRLDGRVASVVKTLEGYDWRVQGEQQPGPPTLWSSVGTEGRGALADGVGVLLRCAGAVDADVAFAVFRQLRVTQDVVSDEELRNVLAAFKRPKDGFVEYKRLLTALVNTPVPLLKAELLFKVKPRHVRRTGVASHPLTPPSPMRRCMCRLTPGRWHPAAVVTRQVARVARREQARGGFAGARRPWQGRGTHAHVQRRLSPAGGSHRGARGARSGAAAAPPAPAPGQRQSQAPAPLLPAAGPRPRWLRGCVHRVSRPRRRGPRDPHFLTPGHATLHVQVPTASSWRWSRPVLSCQAPTAPSCSERAWPCVGVRERGSRCLATRYG